MWLRRGIVASALLLISIGASLAWARSQRVLFDVRPVQIYDIVRGHPTERSVAITNLMNDPVTIKAVAIEGGSHVLAISAACSFPLIVAPAERFEVPVTLSGKRGNGKARLRIVASTPRFKQDAVEFVNFHYKVKY